MESEQVLWFIFIALFFVLFIASVVRYHANPKVVSQLAIFSFLCGIITVVLAVRHFLHKEDDSTSDFDLQQAWLHDTPLPLLLPPLSLLLFTALFDAQRQFFQFYATVLTNYDRWSALHTNPSHKTNPNLFSSAWRYINLVLALIYCMTVIGVIACQVIFNASSLAVRFWLARAIGTSILAVCVLLNLMSTICTRYKMKHHRHQKKLKKETAELKFTTSVALTTSTPEDRSKRSQLILILSPVLLFVILLALAAQMWFIYWALIHATGTPSIIPPSVFGTLITTGMVIDSVFICLPISIIFIIHVFYIKPYPLLFS
ncbi:hypothetical protein [Absidia glauca]|uniref:Uncharacterized protein n=1 Tax=Absidia glauca TaxID=4829 RepID=A0A163ISL7_ABSGL|nr:hypothetical protein [Absidia glauca]